MPSQNRQTRVAAGQLDPEYGKDGHAILQPPHPQYSQYNSRVIAIGPDGSSYIAGQVSHPNYNLSNYTLARLDKNGELDKSFGNNGYIVDFYESDSNPFYIHQLQFIGNTILLTGDLFHYSDGKLKHSKAAFSYNHDGSLNKKFADNGRFVFQTPQGGEGLNQDTDYNEKPLKKTKSGISGPLQTNALFLNPPKYCTLTEQHIHLLHSSGDFKTAESYIIRLTINGELDETFNDEGFVRVKHDIYSRCILTNLIIDDDGNYLTAGYVEVTPNDPDAIVVTKHYSNGKLDTSFQRNGFLIKTPDDPTQRFLLERMIKQPNNRMLFMGVQVDRAHTSASGALFSLEADGEPNIQFNKGKPITFQFDSNDTLFFDTKFQDDGKLLISGLSNISSKSSTYAVARFLYDGTLDTTFGNGRGWINFDDATNWTFHTADFVEKNILISVETPAADHLTTSVVRGILT